MFEKSAFRGKPRSLADAPPPPVSTTSLWPRADPKLASVRFEFRIKDKLERHDAKFNTSQSLSELYAYLENGVFQSVTDLEIIQSYPRAVIPRDADQNLASMNVKGQVLLQVTFRDAKLR
jgi:hypothetical protein